MINTFSGWLFNLMLWGGFVTLVVLLYETFIARGFLASHVDALGAAIGLGVIALLSVFWPKF